MNWLSQRFRRIVDSHWLPWGIMGVILIILMWASFPYLWFDYLPQAALVAIGGFVLLVVFLVFPVVRRFERIKQEMAHLEAQADRAERLISDANARLDAIFKVSQTFVDASDENEIIEPVLELLVEQVGASGAAFVPLDEHGQPQMTVSHGELPLSEKDIWLQHLASDNVQERCQNCDLHDVFGRPADCPLIDGPFLDTSGLFCLPVRRGERDFGVLTLYFSNGRTLDEHSQGYLRALVDETAFGLDSIRLRRRELAALRQMQSLRQKSDLNVLLEALLRNVHRTLETDFALMLIPKSIPMSKQIDIVCGEIPSQARLFLDGILQGVMASAEPVLMGNVSGHPDALSSVRSIAASPLLSSDGKVLGGILVGNRRKGVFSQRQMALLQTIAGQVALVVQNANLMAELEYKTMIQERTRLAREIHDGLAQTIGYLKLQAAQTRQYFSQGDLERVKRNVESIHQTLSEAYQDARQAIDGLRISTDGSDLRTWVEQTSLEFQETSGLPVSIKVDEYTPVEAEIQAQLIRILQEALSNIRKHANAKQVWILVRETDGALIFEVRDDGDGFSPEDVSRAARYGLRGMRERADLIGADFQVISRPENGTTVRVRLPLHDIGEAIL